MNLLRSSVLEGRGEKPEPLIALIPKGGKGQAEVGRDRGEAAGACVGL